MRDSLRELGHLFHAERVSAQIAIAGFAQADPEEGFVGALHGLFGGQAREFGHQADEVRVRTR